MFTLRISYVEDSPLSVNLVAVVGKPDITGVLVECANEIKGDVSIEGFRKGKAPINLVLKKNIKRIRKMALGRLLERIQERVLEEVERERALLGPPKLEYDEEVKLERVDEFSVKFNCMIDPAKDKRLAPEVVAKDPREALRPKLKSEAHPTIPSRTAQSHSARSQREYPLGGRKWERSRECRIGGILRFGLTGQSSSGSE